ncbi:MAG: 23S rRNA (adenine(2030)-N(6))-methyltransferase RlmJ [Hyphomicrobiaceae bacterium]|nr:23S rRNA (adenine(2030)-N(6))-methyltransferase RlmJ [Hyphomicrobiaceae bacterium]
MNYRHAYHAGNFGDVLKHATLALVIEHLKRKPAPFRVVDTHAGVGLSDLERGPAEKTGEWRQGIGRIHGPDAASLPDDVAALLAPYLTAVAAENAAGGLHAYPGSPCIARALLRPQDRLVANELHPEDGLRLKELFQRDRQTKVLQLDGWIALKSLLPPKERRGVVLVDPPFEEPGELERLALGLREAAARFPTGAYLLWYPIKDPGAIDAFHAAAAATGLPKLLAAELLIRAPRDPARLNGAGLVIANPPYRLDEVLSVLLPFLAARLGDGSGAGHRLLWLRGATRNGQARTQGLRSR